MKLALIYGGKSQRIADTIKTIKDNLDIDCFKDIAEFIDMTLKRRIMYDRVLMPTTVVNEDSLNDLEQFWHSNLYNTSIVLLCKKNMDENIGAYFKKHFVSTNVCAMFVDSSQKNSTVLSDAIIMPMTKLNDKYGLGNELDIEDDDGVVLNVSNTLQPQGEQPIQVESEPKTMERPQVQEQSQKKEQPQKKERRALFGKKKDTEVPIVEPNILQQNPTMQAHQQGMLSQQVPNMQEQFQRDIQMQPQQPFMLQTPDMSMWPTPETVMPELNVQNGIPTQNDMFMPNDIARANEDVQNEPTNPIQSDNMADKSQNMPTETVVEPEPFGVDNSVESDKPIDEQTQFESKGNTNNVFVTDTIYSCSDDDFGNMAMGNFDMPDETNKPVNDTLKEVSEDLGSIDLSSAENAYRQQNEQPKIITKEIVREVVRDSGGGIVNSILNGKNPHVLIVTGDRGTGVTSTCLSIASFFCKKTPVLYFDCDTHTHGVLSYINYEEFRNFEPTKMSGTKICKSSKVFDNCVCKFDDNFDIISSDYSIDVTPEELTVTASVVAEKVVDYGLVIVDCPAENLHCISDLLISGNTIVCIDSSKRGFMNMLCALEASTLPLRYKKLMVNKGIMFLTKYNKNIDIKRIVAYVKSIYEPEGVDWMSMHSLPFMGKVDMKILDRVFTK